MRGWCPHILHLLRHLLILVVLNLNVCDTNRTHSEVGRALEGYVSERASCARDKTAPIPLGTHT